MRVNCRFLFGFMLLAPWTSLQAQTPPSTEWAANAKITTRLALTDMGLGAVQGVVVRDGKVYAYGDVVFAVPRVGVIREYDMDLKATGRVVWLTKNGQPLIIHPTGLTWDPTLGTFLGDTVKTPGQPLKTRAVIYHLDWKAAWDEENLDHAILNTIEDDGAVNGCRPTFVTLDGKALLATADYGEIRPEVRLYDPAALLAARRSSAPGVVVHRFLCGPFNQNLHWDAATGRLICIQNVIEGKGWRLDEIDLAKAVADGRVSGPDVRIRTLTFEGSDELEGYWPLDAESAIFAAARRKDNLTIGTIRPRD